MYDKSTEINLVMHSWLETYKYSPECKFLTYKYYKKYYSKLIKNILDRPDVRVIFKKNSEEICSWVCYEKDVLHYSYTKYIYRKKGYMRGLLEQAGFKEYIKCSYMNSAFKRIYKGKAVYEPFYKYNNV